MTGAGFFGKFGDKITFKSKGDLLNKTDRIDITVPSRTQGRKTDHRTEHRERNCIILCFRQLARRELLRYPCSITKGSKSESPDFILEFSDGQTVGIEHTDIGRKEYQRVMSQHEGRSPETILKGIGPYHITRPGEEPPSGPVPVIREYQLEREWVRSILEGWQKKTERLNDKKKNYKIANDYWLILYDNTGCGGLSDEDAYSILREELIQSGDILGKYERRFSTVSVITSSKIYYDLLDTQEIWVL